MNTKQSKPKRQTCEVSQLFFKGLQQKLECLRTTTKTSLKESSVRVPSKRADNSRRSKSKGKESTSNKTHAVKNVLDISKLQTEQQSQQLRETHSFDAFISSTQQLAEFICLIVNMSQAKFVCVRVEPISHNCPATQTSRASRYIEAVVKCCEKAAISIYSVGKSDKPQFYDMLSIRTEVQSDTKCLVQANICNNNKRGKIIRKLVEVAEERQKRMSQQDMIGAVVIRITGTIDEKQNNCGGNSRQIQLEISSGGFGEMGNRDLMGVEQLRTLVNVVQCGQFDSFQEICKAITNFRKLHEAETQRKLVQKIKVLQLELQEKRKQLQNKKIREAEQSLLDDEVEDLVLPSERPMIDVQKLQKKHNSTVFHSRNQSFHFH